MKRLYYLVDTLKKAGKISDAMHSNGISDWNFHVLSKDEKGIYQHHLHGTSFVGQTDIIHSGERGALFGFLIGVIASLIAQVSTDFGGGVLFLMVIFFTCFGAWSGGLVGISHVNYKLARFQKNIDAGACLVMIDVPKAQSEEVHSLMQGYGFSENKAGEDTTGIPNPFTPNKGGLYQN